MLSLPAAMIAMAITGSGTGETVLLDFYADWCGPCRSMMPTVEQLSARGYPVRRMNVDQYRDLAQRFGIKSIPCFVMLVNGREAGRVVGPTSIGRLEQLCSLGRAAAPNPNTINPNTMLAMPAQPAPSFSMAAPASPPVVPVSYAAAPQQQPASDAAMLAASVRIRVEDPQGHSCGSGTIIDKGAGGEALVLTCGHLFRDSQGTGKIEVDVYGHSPAAHVPGRLVAFDLERDVGLIAFRPQGPVMVARVAPPGYSIRPGDAVASVGCNNGDDPTIQHSRVNSLDRFLDPAAQRGGNAASGAHAPWNLQVAGQPIVGRSGGGLFSSDGMVIGVCNAAEPVDHEGLFAALGSIQAALDQQRLASLYHQSVAPPALAPAANGAPSVLVAADPFSANHGAEPQGSAAPQVTTTVAPSVALAAPPEVTASHDAANGSVALASDEQAFMERIGRNVHVGSEIVCVVRDPNDPQAKGEVITLNHASTAFVKQLSGAMQPQSGAAKPGIPTSLEVPERPTPILEWDIATGWKHQRPLPQGYGNAK